MPVLDTLAPLNISVIGAIRAIAPPPNRRINWVAEGPPGKVIRLLTRVSPFNASQHPSPRFSKSCRNNFFVWSSLRTL